MVLKSYINSSISLDPLQTQGSGPEPQIHQELVQNRIEWGRDPSCDQLLAPHFCGSARSCAGSGWIWGLGSAQMVIAVLKPNAKEFDNFLYQFTYENEGDSILDSFDFNASPYNEINISTRYVDLEQLPVFDNNQLSVISINIQSLPAKFNDLVDWLCALAHLDRAPDVVCIQEIWQIHDIGMYNIEGYHPLIMNCRTTARGGGVGIYLKNNLNFKLLPAISVNNERVLESIFVEVSIFNKKNCARLCLQTWHITSWKNILRAISIIC